VYVHRITHARARTIPRTDLDSVGVLFVERRLVLLLQRLQRIALRARSRVRAHARTHHTHLLLLLLFQILQLQHALLASVVGLGGSELGCGHRLDQLPMRGVVTLSCDVMRERDHDTGDRSLTRDTERDA
jgi:hypothetical protein